MNYVCWSEHNGDIQDIFFYFLFRHRAIKNKLFVILCIIIRMTVNCESTCVTNSYITGNVLARVTFDTCMAYTTVIHSDGVANFRTAIGNCYRNLNKFVTLHRLSDLVKNFHWHVALFFHDAKIPFYDCPKKSFIGNVSYLQWSMDVLVIFKRQLFSVLCRECMWICRLVKSINENRSSVCKTHQDPKYLPNHYRKKFA